MKIILKSIKLLFIVSIFFCVFTGCSALQNKINEYSNSKVECSLNKDNVTEFTYKSESYTILNDTLDNGSLGDWIGYIRQIVAVDKNGKILVSQNAENSNFSSLANLKDSAPNAIAIISFLNCYAAPNDNSYLIVDADGSYHKAIPTARITKKDSIFDFKSSKNKLSNEFSINPENVTEIISSGITYKVTSEIVPQESLGNYISILTENITFDDNTKKQIPKNELNRIDWKGTNKENRRNWSYGAIYEINGTDTSKAVAVEVNNEYHLAKTN